MASGVQIQADIRDVLKRLRAVPERLRAAKKEALLDAAKHIYGQTLRILPDRSGRLRASLWYDQPDSDTARIGYIQASGGSIPIYAGVREFGPKGGVIRAKNKPYLVFPVGGAAITKAGVGGIGYGDARAGGYAHKTEWRRVKEVHQKGGFYLTGTFARERASVQEVILSAVRRAVEESGS